MRISINYYILHKIKNKNKNKKLVGFRLAYVETNTKNAPTAHQAPPSPPPPIFSLSSFIFFNNIQLVLLFTHYMINN